MSTEQSRGTPSYRAPELIAEVSTFSNRVDIWGLGCILYELVARKKAFTDDWSIREYERRKLKLIVPLMYFVETEIRTPLTNLIHEMLKIDPMARPSAQELYALFDILIDSPSAISTFKGDNSLLSRICGPLHDDCISYTIQNNMYFWRPF